MRVRAHTHYTHTYCTHTPTSMYACMNCVILNIGQPDLISESHGFTRGRIQSKHIIRSYDLYICMITLL